MYCEKCDYLSRDNYDWNRHILTRKHKMDNKDNKRITKKVGYHCMVCGRTYKFKSGLSKHKKKCHPTSLEEDTEIEKVKTPSTYVDPEKENLKKEVRELRFIMQEMIKAQNETNKNFHKTLDNVIGKVGNTNNYNNKMSINIYLNEKCKNAMNLTEFVDTLKISLDDLMYTKDHGYVKGISNIFVKQLQDMEPTARPIHCSDKKRLQFYVKDSDKWDKDTSHTKINKTIEDVTIKQIKQIKEWEKEHPNYLQNEKEMKQWHTMIQNAMGGCDDDDRVKNQDSIKKELGISLEMKKDTLDIK